MDDTEETKASNRRHRWTFYANIAGPPLTVIGIAIAVWGVLKPAGQTENNWTTFFSNKSQIENRSSSFPQSENAATSLAAPPQAATPPVAAIVSSSASIEVVPASKGVFVAVNSLSPGSPLELATAPQIHIEEADPREAHLLVQISAKDARKIFAAVDERSLVPIGWKLTSQNGLSCVVRKDLNGLLSYYQKSYGDHVAEMQIAIPNAPLVTNIHNSCATPIKADDVFYLSAQIYAMSPDASESHANVTIYNFSSGPIPVTK